VESSDEYLISWAYWMYKPFNDFTTICRDDMEGLWDKDGNLQEYKIKALTRTYAVAFQGKGIFMKFFTDKKVFITKYILDRKITKPTVLYMNEDLNYNEGYRLYCSHDNYEVDNGVKNYLNLIFKDNEEIHSGYSQDMQTDSEIATIILTPKTFDLEKDIKLAEYFNQNKMKIIYEN